MTVEEANNILPFLQMGQAIAVIFGVVLACISAIVATCAFVQTRRSVQVASTTYLRTALRDVVYRELSERPFKERPGAKIPGNSEPIELLRAAKVIARKEVKRKHSEWDEASHIDSKSNWQNHVAYETAEGLQQLGIAAFTGAVPLSATMANVADVIFDDWLIAASWIKSYQRDEKVWKKVTDAKTGTIVAYHRRHAEWIFLVALSWIRRQGWMYPDEYAGNPHIPNEDECIRRLVLLSKADGSLLPNHVRKEVGSLTGVAI